MIYSLIYKKCREDVAETSVAWYAWFYKPSTVPQSVIDLIGAAIPNRLKVFSELLKNQNKFKAKYGIARNQTNVGSPIGPYPDPPKKRKNN